MLFKNNGGKIWWTCFRDPHRPGKFIRKSTGTTVLAEARSIERAEHLAIKRQISADQLRGVFDAIFGASERARNGLPVDRIWIDYEGFVKRKDRQPGKKMMRDRKRNLDEFIKWMKNEYPIEFIEDVTFDCALKYAAHLKRKRKLKDKSRKEYISNLSSIWNALGALRNLRNPWKDVRPAVRDGQRHGAFTREQERAILDAARACPTPHWYEASLIARWTGLRKHDIAMLEWKAVDFKKGVIRTTPIKTQGYDIAVEIPMVEELRAALERLPRNRRRYVLPDFAAAYPKAPQKYEFASVLAAANVDDPTLSFHSWRHTFRTRLAEAGVSSDLAKRLGGWTQDATVQRYDHADKTDEIRRAIASTSSAARP